MSLQFERSHGGILLLLRAALPPLRQQSHHGDGVAVWVCVCARESVCMCMCECVCMCMCVCARVHVSTATERKRETKEETAVSVLAANNYSRPVLVWLTKACHLASCINSLSATYFEAVTRHGNSLTDECLSWDSLSRISNAILARVFLNFSFLYRPTSALRPSTTWRHRFISVRITLGHLIHTQPHPSQGGVWLGWWSKQQATCAIASHFALPHVG